MIQHCLVLLVLLEVLLNVVVLEMAVNLNVYAEGESKGHVRRAD